MPRNVKLLLAYDGTAYHGWGRQKNLRSLQQTLEEAIRSFSGEEAHVVASGRTDAGVHALGQVANFRTGMRHDCGTIRRALNALLPADFRVLAAEDTDPAFHAIYAAKRKLYRYVLHDGPVEDPFLRRYAWHHNGPLDDRAMHDAGQCLVGTHDFSSFETAGAPRQTSVRTVSHLVVMRGGAAAIWPPEPKSVAASLRDAEAGFRETRLHLVAGSLRDPERVAEKPDYTPDPAQPPHDAFVFLEVAADGFLYNMVRAITGTLVQVGRRYWPQARVRDVLAARDRTQGGPTAPPHGLFLVRVDY